VSLVSVSGVTSGSSKQELDHIFREHYELVYRTAYGVTGSQQDAEDVLQTIFLRLLRQFPAGLRENPKAYLYRAAVNLSLNTIRSRQRHVLTKDVGRAAEISSSDDSHQLEELHQRLYEAIAKLDSDAAQTLILRYVHNYSDAEIAKLLGKSRVAIAVRLVRLRTRLKQLVRASQGETS
jgi:RNA polymerase sigma-70 factor (ECF subfamily)